MTAKVIKSPVTGKFEKVVDGEDLPMNKSERKSIDEIVLEFKAASAPLILGRFRLNIVSGYLPGELINKIYELHTTAQFRDIDLNSHTTIFHFSNGEKIVI